MRSDYPGLSVLDENEEETMKIRSNIKSGIGTWPTPEFIGPKPKFPWLW